VVFVVVAVVVGAVVDVVIAATALEEDDRARVANVLTSE
jgi:type III secretory pathway component EscS